MANKKTRKTTRAVAKDIVRDDTVTISTGAETKPITGHVHTFAFNIGDRVRPFGGDTVGVVTRASTDGNFNEYYVPNDGNGGTWFKEDVLKVA